MQITDGQPDGVLKIAGDVGIAVAEQLHHVLREYVRTASRPTVDLSHAETCDTAAFQLLISARDTAERARKPFEFVGLPAAILDAGAVLGLSLTGRHAATRRGAPDDATAVVPAKRGT